MRESSTSSAGAMGTIDRSILEDIVCRVVEVAAPEKIVLFGSAARGDMGPDSDVDLLVVKGGVHRRDLAGRIYENLWGVGAAVDIVVVTPDDIQRFRNSHALVIKPALRDGRVVYEAARELSARRSARMTEPRKQQLGASEK